MTLRNWLLMIASVIIFAVVACGVYADRQWLPWVGGVFLIAVSVAAGSVIPLAFALVAWVWLHVREKKRKGDVIHLEQHGAYVYHGGTLQALHPASVHTAGITAQLPRTTVQEEAPQPVALPAPAPLLSLPSAPDFRLIAHQIAPGRLVLGYNARGAIFGDVSDLLSTAIVGRPGTGKTTMLRLVCAQILQIGGQPILLDPHGSIADEVGDVIDCAESGTEISEFAEWIADELNQRLTARRAKQAMRKPLLVLADEWPIISKLAPGALDPIQRLILEGRKVNMFALICGQGLPAELLGGTLARDALASRYVFNTTAQQARLAGLDNDTAKTMLTLLDDAGPGKAILASSRRKPEIVAIPAIESSDLRSLVPMNIHDAFTEPVAPIHAYSDVQSEYHHMGMNASKMVVTGELMNTMNEPVKPVERKMNIQITSDERSAILAAANTQKQQTGKVVRTKVRDALSWNNADFPKIKQVLDEEGL